MKAISEFFTSHGMDPFLAGLIIGIVLCAVARIGIGRSANTGRLPTTRQSFPGVTASHSEVVTKNVSITLSGKEIGREESAAIMAALDGGNKIEAIKRVREATGMGLKEAKDMVEAIDKSRA